MTNLHERVDVFNTAVSEHENKLCDALLTSSEYLFTLLQDDSSLAHLKASTHNALRTHLNDNIRDNLRAMMYAENRQILAIHQRALLQTLDAIPVPIHSAHQQTATVESLPSIAQHRDLLILKELCIRQANALTMTRHSYLENMFSLRQFAKGFTWITLGAAVIIAGLVVPEVMVPIAIGIGLAGVIYGVIDVAKEAAEMVSEKTVPELGERDITKLSDKTQDLLVDHEPKMQSQLRTSINRYQKRLGISSGIAIAATGLALGIILLAVAVPGMLLPPVTLTIASVVALAVSATAATYFTASFLTKRAKCVKASIQVNTDTRVMQHNIDKIMQASEQELLELSAKKQQQLDAHEQLSSSAYMDTVLADNNADDRLSKAEVIKLKAGFDHVENVNLPKPEPIENILGEDLDFMFEKSPQPSQSQRHKENALQENNAIDNIAEDEDGGESGGGNIEKNSMTLRPE